MSIRCMSGTEACAKFVCILLFAASALKPDRPRESTSPRARTETRIHSSQSEQTAVQNFTSLTELRTTPVEEKRILWVRGRRHDMMHDAFDDIPPRETFNAPLPVTCFSSPRGSSNKACSVTNAHEPGILEVSQKKI